MPKNFTFTKDIGGFKRGTGLLVIEVRNSNPNGDPERSRGSYSASPVGGIVTQPTRFMASNAFFSSNSAYTSAVNPISEWPNSTRAVSTSNSLRMRVAAKWRMACVPNFATPARRHER